MDYNDRAQFYHARDSITCDNFAESQRKRSESRDDNAAPSWQVL